MATLFVELNIPDTTAHAALQCLRKMNIPDRSLKRMDMYEFESDNDITQQLMNTDIIANKHKHRCHITCEPGTYIQVKDKEVSAGLLNTLKDRLGIELNSIEKNTLWKIDADNVEQAAQLLCNRHYQEYTIRDIQDSGMSKCLKNTIQNSNQMKKILVVFGSSSDAPVYNKIADELRRLNLSPEVRVISAHRTPNELDELLKKNRYDGIIAGAGLAAHLPGVIAAKVTTPIIGVPCNSNFQGLDSLLSIMQMPPGIPVLSVGVDQAEQAAINMAEIVRGKSKINIVASTETKAVASCTALLQELHIPFKKQSTMDPD